MSDALLGALIGGLLALAGTVLGFLGTLGIRALDLRRQDRQSRRDLIGYLELVIAGLATNRVVLEC